MRQKTDSEKINKTLQKQEANKHKSKHQIEHPTKYNKTKKKGKAIRKENGF